MRYKDAKNIVPASCFVLRASAGFCCISANKSCDPIYSLTSDNSFDGFEIVERYYFGI